MNALARTFGVLAALVLLICAIPGGSAQNAPGQAPVATPGYTRLQPIEVTTVQAFTSDMVLVMPDGTTPNAAGAGGPSANAAPRNGNTNPSETITGLDTVPTFAGAFAAQGGPSLGTVFPFVMTGSDPLVGKTTQIPAKFTTVSLTLLNADGSVFTVVPFTPFEDLTLNSPNFESSKYASSDKPTQFADAIQRAEFFNTMDNNWHTMLTPSVVDRINIVVPRTVRVRLSNGTVVTARTYFTQTAQDGSTVVFLLDLLFEQVFFPNAVVADINGGNFTTDAVNIDILPNTFLFSLTVANPNAPGGCCVVGFHPYFFAQGVTPQPRWISIFASWISPGIFSGGFGDITALSHEISEALNDPFGNNPTPNWQFPNQPANSKVCQNNLETGDPVESLPVATVPIFVKERGQTFVFHPQTEALLQWFEMGAVSNAIDGAFSFPNETALTKSAVPCPQ